MMSDANTTIQLLKKLLKDFRDERDWKKFHDPKNLAEAISIEAFRIARTIPMEDTCGDSAQVEIKP